MSGDGMTGDELSDLFARLFEAAVAAEMGIPGAGGACADLIEREAPFASERVARATARDLATRRPRDFYLHG